MVVSVGAMAAVVVAMLALGHALVQEHAGMGRANLALVLAGEAMTLNEGWLSNAQLGQLHQATAALGLSAPEKISAFSVQAQNRVDHAPTFATMIGLSPSALMARPGSRLVSGRWHVPGRHEVVVGSRGATRYREGEIGGGVYWHDAFYEVVGVIQTIDALDLGFVADHDTVAIGAGANGALVELKTAEARQVGRLLQRLSSALRAGFVPTSTMQVLSEREFYRRLGTERAELHFRVARAMAAIMGVAALFCTLCAGWIAVSVRKRELGTLRALGFGPVDVGVLVLGETLLLAGAAATLGGLAVAGVLGVIDGFAVDGAGYWDGVAWALGAALLGGVAPAVHAARCSIAEMLQTD